MFFDEALLAMQSGNMRKAEVICLRILANAPDNFDALHMLAVVCSEGSEYERSEKLFRKAISADPTFPPCYHNFGLMYVKQKKYVEALVQFDKALSLFPNFAPVLCDRGSALKELRRLEEALASLNKATSLAPNHPIVWFNRGNVFVKKQDYISAVSDFERAIKIDPNYADAWAGRGNVCHYLKRYDEAFAAYDKALSIKPDLADAWLGRGNMYHHLKRYDEAFAAYDKALSTKPDLAEAWLGRGNVYQDLKRYKEAFAAYDRALSTKPDLAEAWLGRGNVYQELKRYDEAFVSYNQALALEPDLSTVEGARLHCKMHLCDWNNFTVECERLISSTRSNRTNTQPFSLIAIPTSREDQLKCADLWIRDKYPASAQPLWGGDIYDHDKIRIAYVSADFHQHATSYLMAGMFECHDKTQFEITAVSIGPDDTSELRARLKNSFDNFFDARLLSDDEIAHRIKEREIDILIDLKGFTQDSRTGIFARRPAPIQVNYLGFPATMGADYIDYIIADRILVPESHRRDYSEKIAYLPNSYQANDSKRTISEKVFSREEMGLKDDSFVFCCFNNSYKIVPEVFECWIRIIKKVEGSVLWLLESNETATRNLRMEARAKGIDPERLVFAKKLPASDHLARHRLADLFLDTLPCNAHTTASEALWAGLPVLTQIGETFAGRVAASLLNAINIPELITLTTRDYEDLAVELGTNPKKIAAIKRKLLDNRLTKSLFDTPLFARHIEAIYMTMHERYQANLPPEHIDAP